MTDLVGTVIQLHLYRDPKLGQQAKWAETITEKMLECK
jgi:hypothetical protein